VPANRTKQKPPAEAGGFLCGLLHFGRMECLGTRFGNKSAIVIFGLRTRLHQAPFQSPYCELQQCRQPQELKFVGTSGSCTLSCNFFAVRIVKLPYSRPGGWAIQVTFVIGSW
jgi:hypothetical protein